MLVLGYVKSIQNYTLSMALPNGLSGIVPITNISNAYTEKLQSFAHQDADSMEEAEVSNR